MNLTNAATRCLLILTTFFGVLSTANLYAQEGSITNSYEDLKRKGTVNEENSEMRLKASPEAVEKLINEIPPAGFFCFTEDRLHDIRLQNAIPSRWTDRPAEQRTRFEGTCAPGEFFTWQIGVYAPYFDVKNINLTFSDFTGEKGKRIKASGMRCFNLGGINPRGIPFRKTLSVAKGEVQALWIGMDVPADASGMYKGKVTVTANGRSVTINAAISVTGSVITHHGDDEGWRKSRLRWLDSKIGESDIPTAPYTPLTVKQQSVSYLGGTLLLNADGLPQQITTRYDQSNRLSDSVTNRILDGSMRLVVETESGVETIAPGKVRITNSTPASVAWTSISRNSRFVITCNGEFGFDGLASYKLSVKALKPVAVKDIRLEVPYSRYASKYMMGLGRKGGLRPDSLISWHWDIDKHQDKVWIGNVNAGLNFCFMDESYVRPLVNIYYSFGKLMLPKSWGNGSKGGINIKPEANNVRLTAFSGERSMGKDETLHYNFRMLITPVKPINLKGQATERFYHSNSDVSASYIPAAKEAGANYINIHHKKDVYPFINYPYYDEAVPALRQFIQNANKEGLKVRVYYTTRELTVKIPELWALRSLGSEVIHDGPGKDARTLIHPDGPNEWLSKNLVNHFIPAWYNAFREGRYAGDMDISVITTPDSRWNNYYLEGLSWMVNNLGVDGIYIDDSALDRETLQRARRIFDADGKRRLIDIHSWNHMNSWAGYANSIQLYLELLPYVDRTWLGEGFGDDNTPDFWLVEMSGIPFGLMSEMLDARNQFRGMTFGMLPRLPWSGNPVPLWNLWDKFGMKDATLHGFWEDSCPVKIDNDNLKATVYTNGSRALLVVANWTDMPQKGKITIDDTRLGFKPTKFNLPEVKNLQWEGRLRNLSQLEIMGRSGLIVWME